MRLAWWSTSARRRSKRVSARLGLEGSEACVPAARAWEPLRTAADARRLKPVFVFGLPPFADKPGARVSTVERGMDDSDRTFVRITIIPLSGGRVNPPKFPGSG